MRIYKITRLTEADAARGSQLNLVSKITSELKSAIEANASYKAIEKIEDDRAVISIVPSNDNTAATLRFSLDDTGEKIVFYMLNARKETVKFNNGQSKNIEINLADVADEIVQGEAEQSKFREKSNSVFDAKKWANQLAHTIPFSTAPAYESLNEGIFDFAKNAIQKFKNNRDTNAANNVDKAKLNSQKAAVHNILKKWQSDIVAALSELIDSSNSRAKIIATDDKEVFTIKLQVSFLVAIPFSLQGNDASKIKPGKISNCLGPISEFEGKSFYTTLQEIGNELDIDFSKISADALKIAGDSKEQIDQEKDQKARDSFEANLKQAMGQKVAAIFGESIESTSDRYLFERLYNIAEENKFSEAFELAQKESVAVRAAVTKYFLYKGLGWDYNFLKSTIGIDSDPYYLRLFSLFTKGGAVNTKNGFVQALIEYKQENNTDFSQFSKLITDILPNIDDTDAYILVKNIPTKLKYKIFSNNFLSVIENSYDFKSYVAFLQKCSIQDPSKSMFDMNKITKDDNAKAVLDKIGLKNLSKNLKENILIKHLIYTDTSNTTFRPWKTVSKYINILNGESRNNVFSSRDQIDNTDRNKGIDKLFKLLKTDPDSLSSEDRDLQQKILNLMQRQ